MEALTGHANLGYHLTEHLHVKKDPYCGLCKNAGTQANETPMHLFRECPSLRESYGKVEHRREDMLPIWSYLAFFKEKEVYQRWQFNFGAEVRNRDVSADCVDNTPENGLDQAAPPAPAGGIVRSHAGMAQHYLKVSWFGR